MIDYKLMYHKPFNAVTESIKFLQNVQQETEENYISEDKGKQENAGSSDSGRPHFYYIH